MTTIGRCPPNNAALGHQPGILPDIGRGDAVCDDDDVVDEEDVIRCQDVLISKVSF